ncbi:hypothetical protein ACT3CD_00155 [Geofilum sp. OHC36d9]|uniref:hypothetical protein n=1 Tax=Geofilum sp. OHC36d9 TaxID=3458413 RepID=UPI0040342CE3
MKIVSILFLLILMIFSGCEKDSESVNGNYDSMHFVRQGGGQIDFSLYSTENVDQVKVIVSIYQFRDTTIQITINRNTENESIFSSFRNAINGKVQINGDFQQSPYETGTWAYIYFITKGKETEVTNIGLRDSLSKFEQLVRDQIESKNTITDN